MDRRLRLDAAMPYLKQVLDKDEGGEARHLSQADSPVLRPWLPGLVITYLIDLGDQFRYVNHRVLAEAGMDATSLHEIALANLAELPREIRPLSAGCAVIAGGNFESSLVLDRAFTTYLDEHFADGALAAMPTRDVLGFCAKGDRAGRERLMKVIVTLDGKGDHPLTDRLLECAGGVWRFHGSGRGVGHAPN